MAKAKALVRSFTRILLLFIVVAGLAALMPKPAAAAEKSSFKVAWSIYVGWMPWDYAEQSGILKKWADKYGTTTSSPSISTPRASSMPA
jgi:NitT/TauT family transport system substrate-binding protein